MSFLSITNNPLNIRYNPLNQWKGYKGRYKGFVKFLSLGYGFRAAFVLLLNYRKKGIVCVRDVIYRWAPSSENDSDAYVSFVCKRCCITPEASIWYCPYDIISAMALFEVGVAYDVDYIYSLVEHFDSNLVLTINSSIINE